jgi:RsiW-degrading membrane proteinase PrsW (M82 family)
MDTLLLVKALIALSPVFLLLVVFDRLDAFDLIHFREILLLLVGGGLIAILGLLANAEAMDGFPIGRSAHSRYVAPGIEEALKAAPIMVLFWTNRLGFKVDAAIAGFAVGAGFSMVENIYFLYELANANVSAWLVRGFGTAIMHGGATALFAVISHEMTERQAESTATTYRFNPLLFIPGLVVAIAIHMTFNHFPDQSVLIMAVTLLLVPATIFLALNRSDRATQRWLAADKAAHTQMLADIRAGRFNETPRGQTVQAIANRMGNRAADARAYIELKTELILRAEELILAAQAGAPATPSAEDSAKFAQLAALERRLGKAALAALAAPLGFTRNDLWELSRLRARVRKLERKKANTS